MASAMTCSPPSASAEELLAGVCARDPRAWERFVDRYGPIVLAVPARAGLRGADADDVVQATWLQLLRHAPLIREPRSIPAWILRTAAREAWRLRSTRARAGALPEELEQQLAGADEELEEELLRLERAQAVREGLEALGPRCRELLSALFLRPEPPAYDALAAELGVAVGSIGPTRQRCLARLAVTLEDRGFAAEDDAPRPHRTPRTP